VRAVLRELHSPDVYDLRTYRPPDPTRFSLLVEIWAGPDHDDSFESFDVRVCSPAIIAEKAERKAVQSLRHYVLVAEYDYDRLEAFVRSYCARCEGDSWREIAVQLARLGHWEFEDYNDEPPYVRNVR
jgi:hypothetical protein